MRRRDGRFDGRGKIDPKKKLKILKRCLKILKKSDESLVALLR